MPLVKENLLYTPGGLMGQSVRAIDRGAEMNEERFIPEYMRKSASIQLPDYLAAEDSTPFLTNIEAGPWLSTLGGHAHPSTIHSDTVLSTNEFFFEYIKYFAHCQLAHLWRLSVCTLTYHAWTQCTEADASVFLTNLLDRFGT